MIRDSRHAAPTTRGYSLPVALLMLALLAAAAAAALLALRDSAATTATAINRRQSFYACDGVGRVAMIKAREYMQTASTPTTAGLMTAVCGDTSTCPSAPTYAPTGYTIDRLDLSTDGSSTVAPLPSGPFRGMIARQTQITIDVNATKIATGARCHVDETVVLGQIGLFQFFVFSDGYMDLFPGPMMNLDGQVHVNGDWCMAANTGLRIRKITASGSIRRTCTRGAKTGSSAAEVLVDGSGPFATGTFRTLEDSGQSGCGACSPGPGTGAWLQYSLARWNGNIQDSAHDVPNLRMPFVGSADVQDALDQSGNGVDNSTRMRALIDPVMPGDSSSTSSQKLAMQADIRIINGVWYKNDGTWPGQPIWSDHPLDFTTKGDDGSGAEVAGVQVGQAQLFGGGAVPRRYSYYEYDRANFRLSDGAAGGPPSVISYGTLHRTTADPGSVSSRYTPGFHRTTAANAYCNNAGSGTDTVVPYSTACGVTYLEDLGSNLLEGTRGGFQDPRVRGTVSGGDAGKWRMMPLNFDVEAFTQALQDTSSGELGSHFVGGFNGIVFIMNTWPGSASGMNQAPGAATPPPLWPDVNSTSSAYTGNWTTTPSDMAMPRSSGSTIRGGAENNRLPMNLCADNAIVGAGATRFAGRVDGLGARRSTFIVPKCEMTPGVPIDGEGSFTGTLDDNPSRPNAVRVIHAATINPVVFPRGLSIVTNGPMYLLGDTNSASNGLSPPPAGNWRPLMIAGDAVTFVSNAWKDHDFDWDDDPTAFTGARNAPQDTRYLVATIMGNVETAADYSGGLENFPRFIENWPGKTAFITGSLVNGFRSVFQRQRWGGTIANGGLNIKVYVPPNRTWAYDTNLALPANQPPGTPTFFVQAVQRWNRD